MNSDLVCSASGTTEVLILRERGVCAAPHATGAPISVWGVSVQRPAQPAALISAGGGSMQRPAQPVPHETPVLPLALLQAAAWCNVKHRYVGASFLRKLTQTEHQGREDPNAFPEPKHKRSRDCLAEWPQVPQGAFGLRKAETAGDTHGQGCMKRPVICGKTQFAAWSKHDRAIRAFQMLGRVI